MVRVDETDEDAAVMADFVRTRDRRMFEQLFQRYRRAIVAHAARYVKDPARAEELAQEVFVRVYTTKAYEPSAKFKTWLYRVATNLCLNEIRRPEHREKRAPLEGAAEDPRNAAAGPPLSTPEDAAAHRELADRLGRALDKLPPNQRAAFLMSRHDHMSLEEIAASLDTSVSAVKSLIHRALESLRCEVSLLLADPALKPKEANP